MSLRSLRLALCGVAFLACRPAPAQSPWVTIEEGLALASFPSRAAPEEEEQPIQVLRIDPERFELRLCNASAQPDSQARTAREWCEREGLLAAINASMYATDRLTSVSLMRTRTHVNNRRLTRDRAMLAFDPLLPGLPPAVLLDRDRDDFEGAAQRYGSLVQSIRMVSHDRRNVWSPQPRRWSTAAIGIDGRGRVLFIHARAPWVTHDLVDRLLELPIDLARLMYVEGGPEAQMCVRGPEGMREFVGSYETGFFESDENPSAWPVPNVVAVARRGP